MMRCPVWQRPISESGFPKLLPNWKYQQNEFVMASLAEPFPYIRSAKLPSWVLFNKEDHLNETDWRYSKWHPAIVATRYPNRVSPPTMATAFWRPLPRISELQQTELQDLRYPTGKHQDRGPQKRKLSIFSARPIL